MQSTRAGADYGNSLWWIIILANLLKYPFFEFGSRYAAVTGRSLIAGYAAHKRWWLVMYFVLMLITMFTVTAAVSFVTAAMVGQFIGLAIDPVLLTGLLLAAGIILLQVGKFKSLDFSAKVITIVLTITTLVAFVLALGQPSQANTLTVGQLFSDGSVLFIVALMGWMPTALDLSSWNSLWTVEKMQSMIEKPTVNQVLKEFALGYVLSAVMALLFMVMGEKMFFGKGVILSDNSVVFAGQIVSIYTEVIGAWVYPIVSIAAATTMIGTMLTILDGYSRASVEVVSLLARRTKASIYSDVLAKVLLSGVAMVIVAGFSTRMKSLVDLATSISFLIAPFIAWMNLKLVFGRDIPVEHRPGRFLQVLSALGLIFLIGFSIWYLWILFKN